MDNQIDALSKDIQTRLQSDSQSVNDDNAACANCKMSAPARDLKPTTHSHAHSRCATYATTASASSTPALKLTQRRICCLLLLFSLFATAHSCGPGRGIGGPRKNRKLTPLVFKQHVPNMSEKNLGASGLNEGAIRRDSPKFKHLVPNYNKDIIFKDEEGTGADRLMTQRCKEKLNTLAVSVMNQWPGVRLRVTESWDEDNLHGAESLHYEGRAVDITTSDRDRTKYGMLARLAVEAGFDWVYYESRAHIHCSVKSDSSHISHVSGCFSSNSTVLTSSGVHKTMAALQVGDQVLTMTENGESLFSEVILFMDRQLELMQEFVEIRAEDGATLTLTAAHLVMMWNPTEKRTEYHFADKVQEGDFVFTSLEQSAMSLQPQRVLELRAVRHRGVVAPLTKQGTIVVNSMAASCYAIVNSQSLAHWSLLPMRMYSTMKAWLPPSDVKLSQATRSSVTRQNGVHWYAQSLYKLKDYVVPHSWQYQ